MQKPSTRPDEMAGTMFFMVAVTIGVSVAAIYSLWPHLVYAYNYFAK